MAIKIILGESEGSNKKNLAFFKHGDYLSLVTYSWAFLFYKSTILRSYLMSQSDFDNTGFYFCILYVALKRLAILASYLCRVLKWNLIFYFNSRRSGSRLWPRRNDYYSTQVSPLGSWPWTPETNRRELHSHWKQDSLFPSYRNWKVWYHFEA